MYRLQAFIGLNIFSVGATRIFNEGTDEEKQSANELITDLTEKLRIAEIEIVSLKGSRDRFQDECAQLKKQVAAQQRQLKKR